MTNPVQKADAVQALWHELPRVELDCYAEFLPLDEPGRPEKPTLVPPQDVPRRSPFTPAGHAALMHSILHIEFNAINLALDAIWRFSGLPPEYYHDWIRVAHEEAKHFTLLLDHLLDLGYDYGDFVAHDGLWTMCAVTQQDVTARMALVY